MSWNDDDDLTPSFSSEKRFTRADKGKKEKLMKRIKAKFGMEKKSDVQKAELQSQMNLHELKSELAGKRDEETKRRKEEEEKADKESSAPKTKTQKEREEGEIETAQDTLDADTLIERQEQQQEITDEETTSEPG
ncbi:MAG: hypothetical protein QF793_00240 [Candidatus Peribacteraceae bacterium]|jgi:hypothetical protein|nr:hypothetical protein [Candidatus Peribacteraceae bacterium]|tara:strand:- start:2437 stop:2841 length:405 start_codon:yes stop_codon:yes gene_type:complete